MICTRPGFALEGTLAQLQEQYPDWSVWTSETGWPWATRMRWSLLNDDEEAAGMAKSVTPTYAHRATPEELARLLAEQVRAERRYQTRRIA